MKLSYRQMLLVAVSTGLILGSVTFTFAQIGNSITGHIFGIDRHPVTDIYVELLDDFSRTVNRVRTTGSGQYAFYRVPAGRYIVRVLPFGTDYEEQEQSVEITNFLAPPGSPGGSRIMGAVSEQRDFYLRPRKGVVPGVAGTLFVQEVPDEAKKLYETAIADLGSKRTTDAYTNLKAALEIFPKYFAALELLGLEYVRAGHFEAARILLTMAVDVNPRGYKSWHGLGLALSSLKSPADALKATEKSIEINAAVPESQLLSGALHRQAKNYAEAEKRLLKAKDLANGALPDVHWELALLYAYGLKRYREASRELKLYLKARPEHKDAESLKKLIVEFENKAKES